METNSIFFPGQVYQRVFTTMFVGVLSMQDPSSSERTEKNGQTFVKELEAAGIPLRTYIKEGGHGFAMGGQHLRASVPDMDDFLVENIS